MPGYWPGMSAIFGGLLISIIILRIARPRIYWDWAALGILEVGLGVLLKLDPLLASALDSLLFFCLLAMAAVQLCVIGTSLRPGKPWAWLGAAGIAILLVETPVFSLP